MHLASSDTLNEEHTHANLASGLAIPYISVVSIAIRIFLEFAIPNLDDVAVAVATVVADVNTRSSILFFFTTTTEGTTKAVVVTDVVVNADGITNSTPTSQ